MKTVIGWAILSAIFAIVSAETCKLENHRSGDKIANVNSAHDNDSLWVNLTLDDAGGRDKVDSYNFQVKFGYGSAHPVLQSVRLNKKLLCVAGADSDDTVGTSSRFGQNFDDPSDYYYWKSYKGKVPKDAFLATTTNGKKVYIGSALYRAPQGVLPGPTYENDKSSYSAAFYTQVESSHNVKILCTQQSEKLSWQKVHINNIYDKKNCHFIEGGYEYSYPGPLLIGRIKVGDEYAIGKVILDNDNYKGFESYYKGKHHFRIPEFEALAICD